MSFVDLILRDWNDGHYNRLVCMHSVTGLQDLACKTGLQDVFLVQVFGNTSTNIIKIQEFYLDTRLDRFLSTAL